MKMKLTVLAILALSVMAFATAPAQAIDACFTWSCNCLGYCSFDASCSTGAVEYIWTFDDGTYGTGQTIVHRYDSAGDYDVTLAVNNGKNALDPEFEFDTVQHTVSVGCK